jgi:hypothetical protein
MQIRVDTDACPNPLGVLARDLQERWKLDDREGEVPDDGNVEADLRLPVEDPRRGGASRDDGQPVGVPRLQLRGVRNEVLVGRRVEALDPGDFDAPPPGLVRELLGGRLVIEVDGVEDPEGLRATSLDEADSSWSTLLMVNAPFMAPRIGVMPPRATPSRQARRSPS